MKDNILCALNLFSSQQLYDILIISAAVMWLCRKLCWTDTDNVSVFVLCRLNNTYYIV